MSEVTDEILMQYADCTLSAAEEARVAEILARDPEARARLAVFRDTGRSLAGPYNGIMNAPIPGRLVAAVMKGASAPSGARAAPGVRQDGAFARIARALFGSTEPRFAPAFAAVLVVAGGVVGWFAHGSGSSNAGGDVLALDNGHLVARGALKTALETAVSGSPVRGEDGGIAHVRLSFKARTDTFCRQYDYRTAADKRFSGIGCRTGDGNWQIQFHTASGAGETAGQKVVPVGDAKAAVAGLIDIMSEGDPLERVQEADMIARHWR